CRRQSRPGPPREMVAAHPAPLFSRSDRRDQAGHARDADDRRTRFCAARAEFETRPTLYSQRHRSQSPAFVAGLSRNRLASRIYRRTISTDLWPVCFIMVRSSAPPIAAAVPSPDRSEWAENSRGRFPITRKAFFTTSATVWAVSLRCRGVSCFVIARKTGPS